MTLPQTRRAADGLGDIGPGLGHGGLQRQTLGDARGARAGKRAAGPMRVAGVDAFAFQHRLALGRQQQVDHRLARHMAALHQHRPRAHFQQGLACPTLTVQIGHRDPGQGLGLGRIGGQKRRARHHQPPHRLDRAILQQGRAALGDHHRVHHRRHVVGIVDQARDRLDHLDRAQHPGLQGVGPDVVQHGLGLGLDHVDRQGIDPLNPQGVLDGDRRDRRGGEPAQHGHRLDVGLDARPAAGIRAGKNKNSTLGFAHAAAPENSFNPTMPATISRMQTARTAVAGSP